MARPARSTPERTCFRCDRVFRVASADRRVYCAACRDAYGFPAPTPAAPQSRVALSGVGRSA